MTSVQQVPEYPSPTIVDSRRLMGANLYSDRVGAVLEVRFDDASAHILLAGWAASVRAFAEALSWSDVDLHTRREPGGASLFLSAPVDALMTATEINERSWVAAECAVPPGAEFLARLQVSAELEQLTRRGLAELVGAARARGLGTMFDDEALTLGSGAGSLSWPLGSLPNVNDVPWASLYDVPIALVTGSNGKTTTTRIVSAMWMAAGRVTGWCCSDGVWVGGDQLDAGDYSGPGGAREVLRDHRVQAAVLETARGGILRRGLAVSRADAAIITNISADHFGEYGIATERDLAEAKRVVARVLGAQGTLVLNADDEQLTALAGRMPHRIAWFSVSPEHVALDEHVRQGGGAATVHEGRLMLHGNEVWHDLGSIHDMPITLGGGAPHNTQNVLGAALLAMASGVPVTAIRATLATFGASPRDNPGRLNVLRVGGITVIVDYAHNPEGLASLCETARTFPANRRFLVLGQAGNRDDDQLRALVRAAWHVLPFDEVVIKEMPRLFRGRAPGDVPRVFVQELARLGLSAQSIHIAESEFTAVRQAMSLALAGDLIVCPLHTEQAAVLSWFQVLIDAAWSARSPFPHTVPS